MTGHTSLGFILHGCGWCMHICIPYLPVKTPQKKSRENVSRMFDQNWADALAASNNGCCFEQEKLLALDEEDA